MMLFRKLYQHTHQQAFFTVAPRTQSTLSFMMLTNPALRMFSGGNIRPNIAVSTTQPGFYSRSIQKESPFDTDTPADSSRHHRGLYHGKTHGQRFQRCFSMKKSIVTMKPNVKSRTLRSEILNQSFKLDITMKARKCIMKAGSLDNYLLQTKPADIDSKFGLYLRSLI